MQRSSESIGSLAAALAKAQIELVNPVKSLVGTIRSDGVGGAEQTFRYAPLSSGLDIVRKTLGQHEIATLQTTAIDQAAGTVSLTTVLAHASGEWIASDWPVCSLALTTSPQRMGEALTYARRHALFALVGIAGEDDLDAPDLAAPERPVTGQTSNGPARSGNGSARAKPERRRPGKTLNAAPEAVLEPRQSEALRDQLVGEVRDLGSPDAATAWAQRVLSAKNSLTAADAQRVEEAFQAKLATLEGNDANAVEIPSPAPRSDPIPSTPAPSPTGAAAPTKAEPIDKSALNFPEPRRIRDRHHVKFITKQPCLICGRRPSDAHHLRFAQHRALGRKVSDEFTVPLCRVHHREVHRCGDEVLWWEKAAIDPMANARSLWLTTHPLLAVPTGVQVERAAPVTDAGIEHGGTKRVQPSRDHDPNCETNPIVSVGSQ